MWTPAWPQASITGRMVRTPARWPATRGRCRCRAQRPLPSMMMPICRGRSGRAGSGIAAGAGGRSIRWVSRTERRVGPPRFAAGRSTGSDLEDLSLLLLSGVVNPTDELIGDLLDLADG